MGDKHVPCDVRIYDAPKTGLTKNDRFAELLKAAKSRKLKPRYVLFDSWYASLQNLLLVRKMNWKFCTRLKKNRRVILQDGTVYRLDNTAIPKDVNDCAPARIWQDQSI